MRNLAHLGILSWFALILSIPALSEPLPQSQVPESLRPWINWVLWGHEKQACPFYFNNQEQRHCSFVSSLSLQATDKGATFAMDASLVLSGYTPLPGDDEYPPLDVQVDGKKASVVVISSTPHIRLEPGNHKITGRFSWDAMPEAVVIPRSSAQIQVTIGERKVDFVTLDEHGRLPLQTKQLMKPTEDSDSLEIHAFRRINDDIPLTVTLVIHLQVSGKNREVTLGPLFPQGFVPQNLNSSLAAQFESDGHLRVSLRPGSDHRIEIVARNTTPTTALHLLEIPEPWPREEIWVFEARPENRQVTVSGRTTIDPSQTQLPESWRALPAYRLLPGETLTLDERERGQPEPVPDSIRIERHYWLDFSGEAFTVKDRLTGLANSSWRLAVSPPTDLGRVASDGHEVLITALPNASAGVEIRNGRLNIDADLRLTRSSAHLPATLWSFDVHSLAATLHLPPGWGLLATTGVDTAEGTWLSRWNLMNLFLALIIGLAVWKLFGITWGVVALLCQVLIIPETTLPTYAILALLPAIAIRRFTQPSNRLARSLDRYLAVTTVVALLTATHFATSEIQQAIYPTLERPETQLMNQNGQLPISTAFSDTVEDHEQAKTMATDASSLVESQESASGSMPSAPEYEPASNRSLSRIKKLYSSHAKLELTQYDPDAVIQTGQGIPNWRWTQVALRWSGPVTQDQSIGMILLSPSLNFFIHLARVGLLAASLFCLLRHQIRDLRQYGQSTPRPPRGGVTIILVCIMIAGQARASGLSAATQLLQGWGTRTTAAEIEPSQSLLEQLRERLIAKYSCLDACAAVARLHLEIDHGILRLTIEAHAVVDSVIPLPGNAQHWLASEILVDGVNAQRLTRDNQGFLLLALSPGVHQIILRGRIPARDSFQIDLPIRPRLAQATAPGWTVEGLHENGQVEKSLVLVRENANAPENDTKPQIADPGTNLPPFLRVTRNLLLDLDWRIETRVTRIAGDNSTVVLRIPLLPGESVTATGIRVDNGHVLVNLGPNENTFVWHSALTPSASIGLKAAEVNNWTEEWLLATSPVWHIDFTGIPVVQRRTDDGTHRPRWLPWPGEQVTINVTKPTAVPGRNITIDGARLTITPGLRQSHFELQLAMRSSRGGEHRLTLPVAADFQSLTINDQNSPIRAPNGTLTLPITPGAQNFKISWIAPQGLALLFRTPVIDLGLPGVNAVTSIQVPQSRWIVYVSGEGAGPAVLFWSKIILLALAALVLGRIPLTPLQAQHWFLLGVGLLPTSLPTIFIVYGFALALGLRARNPPHEFWRFNALQIALAGWATVVLVSVFGALRSGFFGVPDMEIAGNGSTSTRLSWYLDRFETVLPSAQFVSLPMLAYQLAMLAWALWFALFIVKHAKWVFECYSAHGLWLKSPKSQETKEPITSPSQFTPPIVPGHASTETPVSPPPPNDQSTKEP